MKKTTFEPVCCKCRIRATHAKLFESGASLIEYYCNKHKMDGCKILAEKI